jgi:hypothetical protein
VWFWHAVQMYAVRMVLPMPSLLSTCLDTEPHLRATPPGADLRARAHALRVRARGRCVRSRGVRALARARVRGYTPVAETLLRAEHPAHKAPHICNVTRGVRQTCHTQARQVGVLLTNNALRTCASAAQARGRARAHTRRALAKTTVRARAAREQSEQLHRYETAWGYSAVLESRGEDAPIPRRHTACTWKAELLIPQRQRTRERRALRLSVHAVRHSRHGGGPAPGLGARLLGVRDGLAGAGRSR